jgi:transposase-like protein
VAPPRQRLTRAPRAARPPAVLRVPPAASGRPAFLRSLIARGLSDVQLVIFDAHAGLVDAIGAVLPGASWQRCRTHYARNLLCQVPRSAQPCFATLLRTVFEQPDSEAVQAQMRHVLDALEAKFPKAAEHLDAAQHELPAFTAFPREIWRQIRSNNPQERLNKEILPSTAAPREVPPAAPTWSASSPTAPP